MAFAIVYYFLLPIGAAYFTDLFKVKLWGVINFGLLFALSQFIVAWGIAWYYARKAGEFDAHGRGDRARRRPHRRTGTLGEGAMNTRQIVLSIGAVAAVLAASPAFAQAVSSEWRVLTFGVFGAIIAVTMWVTYLAAKRTKTAADFYTAGGGVSGLQNGWAIAGDYLSAASFLGIAGLISLYGYDGFMYSVGWLVAYITVLLVIAEPCRNIGKYTMGDILAFRNNPKTVKTFMAISTITVSTFYLTAQMVGGGVLVKTLIGIDYEISVAAVGVLMLAYVLFGGMVATTYVQIIKAILLVVASLVMVGAGLGPVRVQPARLSRRGGRRRGRPGAGRAAARRFGAQHDAGGARPAVPRAGPALQEPDRPDLARHGARASAPPGCRTS